MKYWTSSYLDVQYFARRFAMAWDENNTRKNSAAALWWYLKNDRTLAIARAFLEMAMATYKVQERIGKTT